MSKLKTKVCPKCNVEKPVSEYWKDRNQPSGLFVVCKVCGTAVNKLRFTGSIGSIPTRNIKAIKAEDSASLDIFSSIRKKTQANTWLPEDFEILAREVNKYNVKGMAPDFNAIAAKISTDTTKRTAGGIKMVIVEMKQAAESGKYKTIAEYVEKGREFSVSSKGKEIFGKGGNSKGKK